MIINLSGSEIRHHINCLHTLRRKYNKHPTDSIKSHIEESESSLLTKITDAKTNYENNLRSYNFCQQEQF